MIVLTKHTLKSSIVNIPKSKNKRYKILMTLSIQINKTDKYYMINSG